MIAKEGSCHARSRHLKSATVNRLHALTCRTVPRRSNALELRRALERVIIPIELGTEFLTGQSDYRRHAAMGRAFVHL